MMAAASSEKGEEAKDGESGVLKPSDVREASLERSSEISWRKEANASLEDGGFPARFIRDQAGKQTFQEDSLENC